jgi:ribosomal protein S18 acetylase RimI-like enzyme
MTGRIEIRDADASDVAAVLGLLAELLDEMERPSTDDLAEAHDRVLAAVRSPDRHMLLAEDCGAVVGLVSFTTRGTLAHDELSGHIDELIVTTPRRRQGIGALLLGAAAARCRALGCEELEVSTEKTNTRARAFYRRCGFDEEAVLLEMALG